MLPAASVKPWCTALPPGFLVVRGILSSTQVAACNKALDAHPEWFNERGEDERLDGRMLPHYHRE
eukprot:COSAG03_NODE_273_length_9568_cov_33.245644_7_plen_65_part_00